MEPKKPDLKVVTPPAATVLSPPKTSRKPGASLYRSLVDKCRDVSSQELLRQTCAALDNAEKFAKIIRHDGPVVMTAHGPKGHPLLRHEEQSRAQAMRGLAKLKALTEPTRNVGRPAHGFGWIPPDDSEDDDG